MTDLNDMLVVENEGEFHFKERLQQAIDDTDLSLRAFANKSALSEKVIRNYLKGESFPTLDRLARIAKAANRSLSWFIKEDDKPNGIATEKKDEFDNDWNRVGAMLSKEDMEGLLDAILSRGVNSLLIPERVRNIAIMIKDLPDDALKEISILINEAQYCSLVGIPFKFENCIQGTKKDTGRRA